MVRAWIAGSGEVADQWVVRDDLGNSYTVASGVPGFAYTIGREYSLFAPDGKYDTSTFVLYPYRTNRRWRDVGELTKTHPATAALVYMQKDKFSAAVPHDAVRIIQDVHTGYVTFQGGGCAPLLSGQQDIYQTGDVVNVGNDVYASAEFSSPAPSGAGTAGCKKTGDAPFILGFKDPNASACGELREFWTNYMTPSADLINGGGASDPTMNAPGVFIFNKTLPPPRQFTRWEAHVSADYIQQGFPQGAPGSVWCSNPLRITADVLPVYVGGIDDIRALGYIYPVPTLRTDYVSAYLTPPIAVFSPASLNMECMGNSLKMTVNLKTCDALNNYDNAPSNSPAGLSLPACMVLVFGGTPGQHIPAGNINPNWYLNSGVPEWNSAADVNLNANFKLVYAAPGIQDFSRLRVTHPFATVPGAYALRRSIPYRGIPVMPEVLREFFAAPMNAPQTGFSQPGQLLARCFDSGGGDVTPAYDAYGLGGYFPGYFEVASAIPEYRDLRADFLAAYPFMASGLINPSGALPSLSSVYFLAQGRTKHNTGAFEPNPSTLECQNLSFYYQ